MLFCVTGFFSRVILCNSAAASRLIAAVRSAKNNGLNYLMFYFSAGNYS